jgi:iron complex outermembrane recepter protein
LENKNHYLTFVYIFYRLYIFIIYLINMKKLFTISFVFVLWSTQAFSQDQVTGIVLDDQGESVTGATILEKGTKNFAITDLNGRFLLTIINELPVTLQVNAVGSKQEEIEIYEIDQEPLIINLKLDMVLEGVTVTARRRSETVQEVPIPISVIRGLLIEDAGAFNVNRVKELVPSVQLYSSNPRNTTLNIRGLGSTFGLTNDGIDPGVGFYVDGIYYARPAATTLDFIDIEQIEVLRGPQGTLFGKNTTAGAFNITTRKASFVPSANFEVSYGNHGYVQAKTTITGPLSKKLAGRISFSGTQRDGTIQNIRTLRYINDINNLGVRGQLLYEPTDKISITLAGDASRQRPDGYAQVVAGVVETERPDYRQFNAIIADLNYELPSLNAFDRIVDHDSPWNSGNDLGGVSLNADFQIGPGTLTSTTAWRYWDWDPSNDRDFTGLQSLAKSNNYSKHRNWSQEIRYAGEFSSRLSGVAGIFAIGQEVQSDPFGIEEGGTATWRFQQSTTNTALWSTPGLFEGYGIKTMQSIKSLSAAVFANVDWEIAKGLHVMPGIRFNYDEKDVVYNRQTYGGLDTATYDGTEAEKVLLQGYKNSVYSNQAYTANADENNLTYNITVSYHANKRLNAYATYSTSFKPVGVNVQGLPNIGGQPATDLAVIKPEDVKHLELGIKTTPTDNFTLNLTIYNTDISDYQTNVQSPELGVNRGYLANAEQVSVQGVEVDANIKASKHFNFYGSVAYTDGKYDKFTNAPLPLEETGKRVDGVQVAYKDISGSRLPGISEWATSVGGEFTTPASFLKQSGDFFIAFDTYYRSEFSSSPSPSAYLNVDGYFLVNPRIGFRAAKGISVIVWGRNIFNQDYFEQLLPAGGNAGHYAGVLGDPRTYGITLRYSL